MNEVDQFLFREIGTDTPSFRAEAFENVVVDYSILAERFEEKRI